MKFADFIVSAAVRSDLAATDREAVIREMLQTLAGAGALEADVLESIAAAILRREELGSTGIGHGVAVPHAKHDSLKRLAGMVAISAKGIDFQSLDGEMVHIFFLLISPSDRPSEHLQGPGVHFPAGPQRHFLPLPPPGQRAGRHAAGPRRSR